MCWTPLYAINTNKVKKTWTPLQTTGGKDVPNYFFYAKFVTDITTRNTEAERHIKNNVQHGPHKKNPRRWQSKQNTLCRNFVNFPLLSNLLNNDSLWSDARRPYIAGLSIDCLVWQIISSFSHVCRWFILWYDVFLLFINQRCIYLINSYWHMLGTHI